MKKSQVALGVGIAVFAISVLIVLWDPLQTIDFKISDLFFRGRGVSLEITIIAIDDASLSPEAGLGRFKDWPRSYSAQLVRGIAAHKPAVIAFDRDFRERSTGMSDLRLKQLLRDYERRISGGGSGNLDWYNLLKRFEISAEAEVKLTHPDDADFEKAMLESGAPIVLTSSLTFVKESTEGERFPEPSGVVPPIFQGENIASGYKNVFTDRDRTLRRFMPRVAGFESFPLAIANAFTLRQAQGDNRQADDGKNVRLSLSKPDGEIRIAYAAKPNSFRTISFVQALAGQYQPADIAGKIVIIGPTAGIIQDFQNTPTSGLRMAGVEVNANMVQQLIEGEILREQSKFSLFFLLFILTVGGSILLMKVNLKSSAAGFVIVLILIPLISYLLYSKGLALNVIYPWLAWIFTGISVLWYRNKTELAAKRELKRAFAHYVSPVIVNEIAKNPADLKLGGKRERISVMFSDIVGFTTFSEKLSPEDTVAVLNDYLTSMTEVIFAYHGTLDKYQGDAIMALFGAPLPDPSHAVNICAAALDMRKALVTLHEKWNSIPSLPFKEELITLDFRVGIATGPAVIGNVGSEKRFDYTAIGDIVNLGSRLESINRKYGTKVIVNKETFMAVTENHNPFLFRKIDTVRVKGKKQATEIFELVCLADTAGAEVKAMLDDFESGRMLYTERNFTDAKQYFEAALLKIPDDGPSQIYKNRCDFYLRKPPGRDWSPVVDLAEK